ncbi:MAG TPA: ABC transporter permease subunit [Jiangellaceae bacterium]
MSAVIVLRQMLKERTKSTIWWSAAFIVLTVAIGASYPTVREQASALDAFMESMDEGFLEMFGAADGSIASPVGFWNSNFYANLFPILLLVLGIGMAAWSIAGAEREGTLEPLLANPVRRSRVALGRYVGHAIVLAVVTAISTAVLIAFRGPWDYTEISVTEFVAAGVASLLLALLFTTITYAIGAATGRKGAAIAGGAGIAVATFVIFALAAFVEFFANLRWFSPWYWFLEPSPLADGWTWRSIGLPLLIIIPVMIIGTVWFTRRDLR